MTTLQERLLGPSAVTDTPKGRRLDLGALYRYQASDLTGHSPDDDRVLYAMVGWQGGGSQFITRAQLHERLDVMLGWLEPDAVMVPEVPA